MVLRFVDFAKMPNVEVSGQKEVHSACVLKIMLQNQEYF